ncbi:MAG: GNAT family N-acetyltransferase [Bacteroidetes bacterium]|nr:GNAT family N-acetyltransferase [Bacteroidota bacterium]MDA1119702.1 GNAT family N-acetyltransferase [Bacteroidota bacterium]
MNIIQMLPAHWPDVKRIYEEGIATQNATFETSCPVWEKWNASHLPHSRWIALIDTKVAGWAALSPVSDRCVYGGVAEVSIYVGSDLRGQGIGKGLMNRMIKSSEENGLWTLNSATFPENTESIMLHIKCGFREIGYRERIGQLDGIWRNTVLMERRSLGF